MARTTHHYRPGSLGVLGCALRSYLRFRAVVCGDKVEALLAAPSAKYKQATPENS
jgi:hypothetical protein